MKIKICGVRNPKDAAHAAQLGADFIGIIFSRKSKRYVSSNEANEIAAASAENGALPVGVFVDETVDEIITCCTNANINIIQLHGALSKQHLPVLLLYSFKLFYAVPVDTNGKCENMPGLPKSVMPIFDCGSGGSGKNFDWNSFLPPKAVPWFLAGGLNHENIGQAIRKLKPYGVDVASGVEALCGTRKDPFLLEKFIRNAQKEKI